MTLSLLGIGEHAIKRKLSSKCKSFLFVEIKVKKRNNKGNEQKKTIKNQLLAHFSN